MISSPWLAQATFSPDPLQSAWLHVVRALAVGGGSGGSPLSHPAIISDAGQPRRRHEERARRKRSSRLLLASNLGPPAPPGCNGGTGTTGTTEEARHAQHHPSSSHPPMTCRPRPVQEIVIEHLSPPTKVTRWCANGAPRPQTWAIVLHFR